jgi:hypothetical protein
MDTTLPDEVAKLTTGRYVAPSQRHPTRVADEVEPSKVVGLAEWVLLPVAGLDREELGGDDGVTVLLKQERGSNRERESVSQEASDCSFILDPAILAWHLKHSRSGNPTWTAYLVSCSTYTDRTGKSQGEWMGVRKTVLRARTKGPVTG